MDINQTLHSWEPRFKSKLGSLLLVSLSPSRQHSNIAVSFNILSNSWVTLLFDAQIRGTGSELQRLRLKPAAKLILKICWTCDKKSEILFLISSICSCGDVRSWVRTHTGSSYTTSTLLHCPVTRLWKDNQITALVLLTLVWVLTALSMYTNNPTEHIKSHINF